MVKLAHQRFANIEDAHSAKDRLIEYQLRSLHMDFKDIFIEYGQSLEVLFCIKFQYLHAVFDLSHIHVIPGVSIVFPKAEMFIGLKKSFSKSFFSFARNLVLNSVWLSTQGSSLKIIPL